MRGLENMDISPDMYGCFLTPIIMQKLPEEFRVVITRNLGAETWDLKDILKEFHKELQLREQCLLNTKELSSSQRGESLHSTAALYSDSNKDERVARVWCSFCNQDHQSSNCSVVTSPESRKQILKRKGKCFLCLKTGHLSRSCQSSVKCFKCKGPHHVAICDYSDQPLIGHTQVENAPSVSTSMYVDQSKGSALLQTATAEVLRPDNDSCSRSIRLLFDSCSQRSYITENLKVELGLPVIGSDSLLIKTFGQSDARLRSCEIVQVGIKTTYGATVYVQACVVPVICGPLTQQPTELAQCSYKHLRGPPLADRAAARNLAVDIRIGADYYWSLVEGTVIRGAPWEPVAIATKLGYVLSEPTMVMVDDQNGNSVNLTATHVLKVESTVVEHDSLTSELRRFWDYESLGIQDQSLSLSDKFVDEVEFVKGKYQVRLPFKENHELRPDNFALCKSRLTSLLKRLSLRPEIAKHYNDVQQLKEGIIEPVEQSANSGVGKVHYLPHHEVIRVDKETTKLRVVYDASARAKTKHQALMTVCMQVHPCLPSFMIFS